MLIIKNKEILLINQEILNKKHTYNFDRNNIKLNMYNNKYNDNIYNNINQLNNEKKYISASKENNEIERYDL